MSEVKKFFESIRVYDTPFTKTRVGKQSDGGYVCLDELNRCTSALYAYGVSDETSFEEDFQTRYPQCDIHMFDHTVDGVNINNPKIHFTKEGISPFPMNTTRGKLGTLDAHLEERGDSHQTELTLKMDIEWNEWSVLENLSMTTLGRFDQVLCEFHAVPVIYNQVHTPYFTEFYRGVYHEINEKLFARYGGVLKKIQSQFVIYHVHINNSLPLVEVDGYKFPPLIELSFVNRALVSDDQLTMTKQTFPVPGLDFPNKPYREDITGFVWN